MKRIELQNMGIIIRRDSAGLEVATSSFLSLHKSRKNHYLAQRIGDNQYRKLKVSDGDVAFLLEEHLGTWSVLLPIECFEMGIKPPASGFCLLVQDSEIA